MNADIHPKIVYDLQGEYDVHDVPWMPKDAGSLSQMPKGTICSKFLVNEDISICQNKVMTDCNHIYSATGQE